MKRLLLFSMLVATMSSPFGSSVSAAPIDLDIGKTEIKTSTKLIAQNVTIIDVKNYADNLVSDATVRAEIVQSASPEKPRSKNPVTANASTYETPDARIALQLVRKNE